MPTSRETRRRRPTTACTTCRDRRVKCDRRRPVCQKCQTGGRPCSYDAIRDGARVEFMTDAHDETSESSAKGNSWSDVLAAGSESMGKTVWQNMAIAPNNSKSGASVAVLGPEFILYYRQTLPSMGECLPCLDTLARCYLPLVPIVPEQPVRTCFDSLWQEALETVSIESMFLGLSAIYIGAATSETTAAPVAASVLKILENLLSRIDYSSFFITSPSLLGLQAYVLLNTVRASRLAPFAAFGFLPLAVRSAQSLLVNFNGSADADSLAKLLQHLVFLDVESTISSGLPCLTQSASFTAAIPSVIDALSLPPVDAAVRGHWLLANACRTWTSGSPPRFSAIQQLCKAIRDYAQRATTTDTTDSTMWSLTYLDLQADRAYCMAGLHFWELNQFKHTSCGSEINTTARNFVRKYLGLANLGKRLGYNWLIPGLIQPLHALLILLAHLSTCREDNAECEEGLDLVNQAFECRMQWIRRGPVVGSVVRREMTGSRSHSSGQVPSELKNPRYRLLWELKQQVNAKHGRADTGNYGRVPRGVNDLVDDFSSEIIPHSKPGVVDSGTMSNEADYPLHVDPWMGYMSEDQSLYPSEDSIRSLMAEGCISRQRHPKAELEESWLEFLAD